MFDWNRTSSSELVGEFRVEEVQLLGILSGATADGSELQTTLLNKGKRVIGNDKQECMVAMKFFVLDRNEVSSKACCCDSP